jgi:Zn-dependent protease with chaperone function
VETRRRINEADLRLTEEMIGRSFTRLKESMLQAPSQAFRPATDLVRQHPFAAAATAAGAGMLAYEVLNLLVPLFTGRGGGKKESGRRSGLTSQLLSLATPYLLGILQKELGHIMAGDRR